MEISFICAVVLVLFVAPSQQAAVGAHWEYEGKDHWLDDFPECDPDKSGKGEQSPIDIKTNETVLNPKPQPFTCDRWNDEDGLSLVMRHAVLKNTGHSAQINVSGKKVCVQGGQLPETYTLAQFHFHWGLEDDATADQKLSKGSEHRVDGHQYPMEVHFVHYADSRGSLANAADKPLGLAVLGFFIDYGSHNSWFDEIVKNLERIPKAGDEVPLRAFKMEKLLPDQSHLTLSASYSYWRYYGSLTTPGCFESVIWTVFKKPIEISKDQMLKFRQLLDGDGDRILNNFRDPQPLHERKVYDNRIGKQKEQDD